MNLSTWLILDRDPMTEFDVDPTEFDVEFDDRDPTEFDVVSWCCSSSFSSCSLDDLITMESVVEF